jgi:hypothetical protein
MVESGEEADETEDGARIGKLDMDELEVLSYSETEGRGEAVEADVDIDVSERCDGEHGHCRCTLNCRADVERRDP